MSDFNVTEDFSTSIGYGDMTSGMKYISTHQASSPAPIPTELIGKSWFEIDYEISVWIRKIYPPTMLIMAGIGELFVCCSNVEKKDAFQYHKHVPLVPSHL